MGSFNSTKKSDKGLVAVTIVMIVIAVLVVALLASIVINKTGIANRLTVVASSDNAKIDRSMLAYYEYELMMSDWQSNYYQYMYCYYGLYEDTYGILDAYSNPNDFAFSMAVGYRDAYEISTIENTKTILALYEAAKAAGTTLTEDDYAEIETAYESIGDKTNTSGPAYYMSASSAGDVIQKLTGCSVNKSDVKRALEMEKIASKYLEKYSDEVLDKQKAAYLQDSAAFKAYADEHKDETYVIGYKTVTFKASDKATAEAAKDAKTVKEIKTAVYNYIMDAKFSEQYKAIFDKVEGLPTDITETAIKTAIDAVLKLEFLTDKEEEETTGDEEATTAEEETTAEEATTASDTLTLAEAQSKLTEAMKNLISTEFAGITEADDLTISYSDSTYDGYDSLTDAQKWLVAAERAVGDTNYDIGEAASTTDATTTATLYEITAVSHLDNEITRDYGYIKVAFDTTITESTDTAKTKDDAIVIANALLAKVKSLDNLVDDFTTVCDDEAYSSYTANYSQSVSKDGTVDDKVGEWLFAAKEGDSAIVETDTAYYVVALGEINQENWAETSISGLTSEELTEWSEANLSTYHVTIKAKFQKKVDKFNEENSTAEVTTVADEATTVADEATTVAEEVTTAA